MSARATEAPTTVSRGFPEWFYWGVGRSSYQIEGEDSGAFNAALASSLADVERGAWTTRDPRARSASMIRGVDG
jgi:hypothetical protein